MRYPSLGVSIFFIFCRLWNPFWYIFFLDTLKRGNIVKKIFKILIFFTIERIIGNFSWFFFFKYSWWWLVFGWKNFLNKLSGYFKINFLTFNIEEFLSWLTGVRNQNFEYNLMFMFCAPQNIKSWSKLVSWGWWPL